MTQEKLNALAADVAGDRGIVVKAVLVFDYLDAESGERHLDFLPSEDLTVWDFRGLLQGTLDATAPLYKKRGE